MEKPITTTKTKDNKPRRKKRVWFRFETNNENKKKVSKLVDKKLTIGKKLLKTRYISTLCRSEKKKRKNF